MVNLFDKELWVWDFVLLVNFGGERKILVVGIDQSFYLAGAGDVLMCFFSKLILDFDESCLVLGC